eukprot:TRINITY_DN1098_c0_g1_i1.p1 TRINITY_DN1098_c0_g1~~TRINITY_DN1098_c0_g1_i1.p1  ORF type:complete len:544 (+),score=88.64 TRINITY_DN1098_c0_g1_i1:267-1898(+)
MIDAIVANVNDVACFLRYAIFVQLLNIDCRYATHHKCSSKVGDNCFGPEMCNEYQPHTMKSVHFGNPTFCNYCRGLLYGVTGKQGIQCTVCRYVSHKNCPLPNTCPVTSFYMQPTYEQMGHFWIEGNKSGKCSVCKSECSSSTRLSAYQCFWCHYNVCSLKCQEELGYVCDLGLLSDIIISPISISTNMSLNVEDFRLNADLIGVPLLVFINKKSGGGLGTEFIKQFNRFLNPLQVIDLANGGPGPGIRMMIESGIQNYKIFACGGDGTVAWVLSVLDNLMEGEDYPPVGVLPLGTGNDLSRSLGWGPGCEDPKAIKKTLFRTLHAEITPIDRWVLNINNRDEAGNYTIAQDPIVVNNYFSVGIDAIVALKFHEKREANPEKFSSRAVNKMWYAKFGTKTMVEGCPNLQKTLVLEIDGVQVLVPPIEALVVVNLPSCYGGAFCWEKASKLGGQFSPMSVSDGLIEVVGVLNSLHLGQIQTGISSPIKIGQGSHIRIVMENDSIPIQYDGEPLRTTPCEMVISYHNSANMMYVPKKAHSVVRRK